MNIDGREYLMKETRGTHVPLPVGRRHALLRLAALALAAGLPDRASAAAPRWPHTMFDNDTMSFLSVLADMLVPDTDTPGALQAKVPENFVALVSSWVAEARRPQIGQAIDVLRADLCHRLGGVFAQAAPARRLEALQALDAAAYGADSAKYTDYREIKGLMLRLYYASQAGATLELRYDPFPGGFTADLPFSEIERPWIHEPF